MNIPGITGTFKTDEALLSKIAGLEDKDLPSPVYSYIATGPVYLTPTLNITCSKTKKRFKFNPQEDLTAIELAWLVQMLVVIAGSHGSAHVDVDSYVASYKLERHFQIT